MASPRSKVGYTAASGKTSLVDRMNLSIHLRKYIKLLTRRWFFLLLGGAIGGGYSWNQAQKLQDQYHAQSKIMMSAILTGVETDPIKVAEQAARFYQQQLDYISSDKVLGKAREKVKGGNAPSTRLELTESGSILMHVNGLDGEVCRELSEVWADEFIAFKDSQKESLMNREQGELKLRHDREVEKLESYRKEVDDFLKQYGANAKDVGDLAQEQLSRLTQQQSAYDVQLKFLQNQTLEQFQAERGSAPQKLPKDVQAAPDENPTRSVRSSDLRELKRLVLMRESEYGKWVGILKPKHPFMAYLKRQVDDANEQMSIARRLAQQEYEDVIKSLDAAAKALQPLIDEQRQVVEKNRVIQEQFRLLQRKLDDQSKTVDALAAQLKLFTTTKTEDGKFEIAEKGKGPDRIVPDRKKVIMNGLMVGLLVGFAIIYFLHRLDDRLELAEDIEEELDEPVLGQIPQLGSDESPEGMVLVTKLDQHNTFAESLRGVRSAFLFGSKDVPKQVLVVTSAVPGDGKTTITTNFAATLAKAGNKVLLVDADLRRGNIHSYFGIERSGGLSEILVGETHWEDAIKPSGIENLDTVTTGKLPGNPGELLISPISAQFIAEARKSYDFILFDCPPLTSIDDTFCLLNLVDGLLFVVKSGHTSMRFAKNALAQVRHRGSSIFGIVLNGITTDHPGYYYYYYYHDYYKTAQEAKDKGHTLPNSQPGVEMAKRKSLPNPGSGETSAAGKDADTPAS